jgi:hypothetical protein
MHWKVLNRYQFGHVSVKTTEKYYVDLVDDNYKSALDGLDKII